MVTGFLSLPANLMTKLASSENLNICSGEEGLLKLVLSWVNHDPDSRFPHVPDVIKNVRLPLIPRNHLIQCLGTEFEVLKKHGKSCYKSFKHSSYFIESGNVTVVPITF